MLMFCSLRFQYFSHPSKLTEYFFNSTLSPLGRWRISTRPPLPPFGRHPPAPGAPATEAARRPVPIPHRPSGVRARAPREALEAGLHFCVLPISSYSQCLWSMLIAQTRVSRLVGNVFSSIFICCQLLFLRHVAQVSQKTFLPSSFSIRLYSPLFHRETISYMR